MNPFKNHPFAVEAFFQNSLVLTFALPAGQLDSLIPKPLELDVFEKKWAFLALALVQTQNLRPKGFPRFLGHDFFLLGYRIFVKYINLQGKKLRGLYILRSETDKKLMQVLGNIFTNYTYTTTDITVFATEDSRKIRSVQSGIDLDILTRDFTVQLPEGSPFENWKEARRYAGPLPFTFTVQNNTILIIEGVRQNWTPKPIQIMCHQIALLEELRFQNAKLASAFEIHNIPYLWKKGVLEKWT